MADLFLDFKVDKWEIYWESNVFIVYVTTIIKHFKIMDIIYVVVIHVIVLSYTICRVVIYNTCHRIVTFHGKSRNMFWHASFFCTSHINFCNFSNKQHISELSSWWDNDLTHHISLYLPLYEALLNEN